MSTNFEKKVRTWLKVGPNDATGLEEFSDFLQQVKIASKHIESLKVLNCPSQIQVLVEKLLHGSKQSGLIKCLSFRGKRARMPFCLSKSLHKKYATMQKGQTSHKFCKF